VKAKEEKDRKVEYPKMLLEYKTFRFLHKYKVPDVIVDVVVNGEDE